MRINRSGWNHVHVGDFCIDRPRGSGDCLMLVIRSDGYFVIGGEVLTVSGGSVMMYREGTPQLYGIIGDAYIDDWFHFTADEAEQCELERLGIPFDAPLYVGDVSTLSGMIRSLDIELHSANAHREESAQLYMRLFFYKLAEKLSQRVTESGGAWCEELSGLRAEIYNRPSLDWTVGTMASRLSLSESYFQHLYRQFFGVSAVADVINSRIEHARYLLLSTPYRVAAVADMCGYKSDVHFMRQFKKLVGVSPTEYRRGNGGIGT